MMARISYLTALLLAVVCSMTYSGEGLVASYDFEEGSGTVVHDGSGNGNHGVVHDARFLKSRTGYCLEFNGATSYVDCGDPPSLDIRSAITLAAWILPSGPAHGEPGILGKHFQSYLMTYYTDGRCYWYIGAGGNDARAFLPEGGWTHVAGTFDGKLLRLYLNGVLADEDTSRFDHIPKGGHFLMGAVAGLADAEDPNYTRTAHFAGLIDSVRVYNRALSGEEIARLARESPPDPDIMEPFTRVSPVVAFRESGVRVRVGAKGEVQVEAGGETYVIHSRFSYPGREIGWNALAPERGSSETSWQPEVRECGPAAVEIAARGRYYRLRRVVEVRDGLVHIGDTITGTSGEPVGLLVRHSLTSCRPFSSSFAPQGAENPAIFLQGRRGNLGVVMEDNVSRLRYQPILGLRGNQLGLRLGDMAVSRGKSLQLRWSLQPLPAGSGWFDFMNSLRRRWNTNYTVLGPFDWISMTSPLLDDPQALKAHLQRKHVGVMALVPWLDYDPSTEDHVWPRVVYKQHALKALRALKAADPQIRVIGCVETDWVTIYPEKIAGGDQLPVAGTGVGGRLSPEQTRIVDAANLPWKDSVKRDAQGCLELELYMRGGKPQTALSVYPAVGNYQYRFLMDQVKFLLDECKLDGYYIDEFSQGWSGRGIRSYEGWDGVSADVDPVTGRVRRTYVDCSLAGVQARLDLVRYALDRGKIVVANTYATAMEERALPVNRFSETQGAFDPMATPDGQKPAGLPALFRSNVGSPIGLGIIGHPEKHDTARRIMKALITYLRHGMVYYHYAIEDIPESGEGSGEYGPINHMFPITPVELREGCILGQERTVTCVSGIYRWRGELPPRVLVFDLEGREVARNATIGRQGDSWVVNLTLRDWAQIAVIEQNTPVLRLRER